MTTEMDDREFIAYCETHSETPRALFTGFQVARLARLCGKDEAAGAWDKLGDGLRSLDLSEQCKIARQRLAAAL